MRAASLDRSGSGLAGEARSGNVESAVSAVSWAGVIAGAFAAAGTTVILVALGSGFGLASVSPWPYSGVSATTFTVMTAVWLIIVQWVSSGIGGYLAGRLRTKWVGVHSHEVFLRDTAHGFLAWATATVIGALLLASATSSLVGGGVHAAATVASGAAQGATQAAAQGAAQSPADPTGYMVDALLRSDHPNANASDQDVKAEVTRIFVSGARAGDVPAADRTYLAQVVAARTGLAQPDAEKRVNDAVNQMKAAEAKAREAADAARKAASRLSIYTGLSMLVGAFIAAVAAALGGAHRDEGHAYP